MLSPAFGEGDLFVCPSLEEWRTSLKLGDRQMIRTAAVTAEPCPGREARRPGDGVIP